MQKNETFAQLCKTNNFVIPAKAGIQYCQVFPGFRVKPGMTDSGVVQRSQGATLGANCTIVCGHTIGSYAFIGAGAVVTKNVPDYALMAGNPAKQIGLVCMCGEKLTEKLQCTTCKKQYKKTTVGLKTRD